MNREIVFFGYRFTMLTFLLLAFAWTISLIFVWPYFLHVSAAVYFGYTIAALLFSGVINRKLLLWIVLVFFLSKSIIVWFQNFMLLFSGFLATLVYFLFVPFGFWKFIGHYFIVTFSIFLYYTLVIKAMKVNEE